VYCLFTVEPSPVCGTVVVQCKTSVTVDTSAVGTVFTNYQFMIHSEVSQSKHCSYNSNLFWLHFSR
jgi:hypothetical protein